MQTARTKASEKYNKKAYDRFLVTVKKGDHEKIKEYAKSKGMSLNGYIRYLIEKDRLNAPR